MNDFGLALAYEAFYQIIAGQQLSQGLIVPRHHFLKGTFPSLLTVEQAILLYQTSKTMVVLALPTASQARPTGFGQ